MRIPDRLLKCVGFISHDQPQLKWIGTIFFIGIKARYGSGAYLHLVTAKHVADAIDPGPFVIALNGKDGEPLFIRSGDESRWWYHPTESANVDVAVLPFATAKLKEYDVEGIPEVIATTDDKIAKFGIGLGDEIIIVGLFTKFFGASKLIPIVRTGNIAMMPSDRVPVKDFGEMEAYLTEGRSIGGLSGSPVFVRNTVTMPGMTADQKPSAISGLGPLHLLGLMHGHWDLPVSFEESEQAEAVNMGISIVIPAKKIIEVLYHPELIEMRKQNDEKARERNYPTSDSLEPEPVAQNTFTQQDFEVTLKKVSRKKQNEK